MKVLRVKIIFAPQFEPFQPYLSLPYLKELLRLYNIQSSYIDCNVDFYNWLFDKKDTLLSPKNKQEEYLLTNIEQAVSNLKNGITNIYQYRWSINVIEEYLQAISTEGFSISLSNLEIENKYDTNSVKNFVYENNNLIYNYFNDKISIIESPTTNFYFFSLVVIEQLPASLIFAKELKNKQSNIKIAFGGPFISRFFNKLHRIEWIKEIVDFIEPEEGYLSVAKILNITQSYTGHISPDYSDIDIHQYLSPKTVFPYLISYGCKWGKCVFCSHHLSYSSYRSSAMEKVVNDLKYINKYYEINYISFSDEYLTKAQLTELCLLLEKENLHINWSTFVRGESTFKENTFMDNLYENGGRVLFFGFETFSQRLLNEMHKGTNANNYISILETCKKASIAVRIDLMFGFPTETEDDAKETFDIIVSHKELFDTPFSSTAIALFELREDTPVCNNADKYGIKIVEPYRGNIDEAYSFTPILEHSSKWRKELMQFFKHETNSELIAPYNKTHQLVLKNLYDEKEIGLMTFLKKENVDLLSFRIHSSVNFTNDNSQYILSNYANGSEINVPLLLGKILKETKNSIMSIPLFSKKIAAIINDSDIIYELINFLYRSDFIILLKNKSHGKE